MADPDRLADGELQQLAYGIETRFAPHMEAAASAVRAAERELEEARERLERAVAAAERQHYRSDPLVFMRELLAEEVDGLERKTNPKKLRTSFRFLVDRAVELAAGEVQGFHDEREAERREREEGVEACREAVRRAEETLESALAMQERVRAAERAARRGLTVLEDKLSGVGGERG
jgi:hypothetical protein